MSIESLEIAHFRNLSINEMACSEQFNLFYGDNAAGKTSFLEAIYYLSTGKSFRAHSQDRLIHHAEDYFSLFIRLKSTNTSIPIGLEKSRDGSRKIRINEESTSSLAPISSHLPVQYIGATSYQILTDGPKTRRQFLDWGLFHTDPTFYPLWKKFQKLLNHRNAALKVHASKEEMSAWNSELAKAGESIHLLRKNYLKCFSPFFYQIVSFLLNDQHIEMTYSPGWQDSSSLLAHLEKNLLREYQIGHTLFGPHRADVLLSVNKLPASDILSQGQQKLVSYALRLAQGLHLQSAAKKTPIYLIDDMPSELDPTKRQLVVETLSDLNAQVFMTSIEKEILINMRALGHETRMFHVKHGAVTPLT